MELGGFGFLDFAIFAIFAIVVIISFGLSYKVDFRDDFLVVFHKGPLEPSPRKTPGLMFSRVLM